MNETIKSWGLGAILAIVVLILVIVLAVIGKMPALEAVLFGMLALARLT
jgi:predicted membrane channel-forming protein YqfA (hemolysin III family)